MVVKYLWLVSMRGVPVLYAGQTTYTQKIRHPVRPDVAQKDRVHRTRRLAVLCDVPDLIFKFSLSPV